MKKLLFLTPVALIALISLAFVSCGSDDDENTFTVGRILPESGSLAFLGPPMIQGFNLAVSEINDADAGIRIESLAGDSGTNADVANQVVDDFVVDGVQGIVGAASSGISLSIIDKVIDQRIVMISPSNTSPTFTDYSDDGYYFRTAPSDILQGRLLAERIIDRGNQSAVILHRADDYGRALADTTQEALTNSGADVRDVIEYDTEAASFGAEAQAAAATGAEALVLIGFEEGTRVISALIENNFGPGNVDFWVSDGLATDDLGSLVDASNPGVVNGIESVSPAANPTSGEATFVERFREFAPDVSDLIFSSQTYDATIILALAALEADSTDPTVYVREINGITKGGIKCNRFAACAELIDDGENIDYDGASGPLEFADVGEPSSAVYDVTVYGSDGSRSVIDQVELSA